MVTGTMEWNVNRDMLKYHVGQVMFCPGCKRILDIRSAVSLDYTDDHGTERTCVRCIDCWDKWEARIGEIFERNNFRLTGLLDGRKLYPELQPKPRRSRKKAGQ